MCKGRYSNPHTGLDRPLWLQKVEAPRISSSQYMKVVSLSALLTCICTY